MTAGPKRAVWAAVLITALTVIVWQATGGDYYTKFEVVEQVEQTVDPDDPLAGTGFYDDDSRTQTTTRETFRLGLLPTPSGLFDRHTLSVVTLLSPTWGAVLLYVFFVRRRRRVAA